MSVPDRPTDAPLPQGSSERDTPKRGGFGEFSAMYRARWGLAHPNMRRQWPTDVEALPLVLPEVAIPEPLRALSGRGRDVPNGREDE